MGTFTPQALRKGLGTDRVWDWPEHCEAWCLPGLGPPVPGVAPGTTALRLTALSPSHPQPLVLGTALDVPCLALDDVSFAGSSLGSMTVTEFENGQRGHGFSHQVGLGTPVACELFTVQPSACLTLFKPFCKLIWSQNQCVPVTPMK